MPCAEIHSFILSNYKRTKPKHTYSFYVQQQLLL